VIVWQNSIVAAGRVAAMDRVAAVRAATEVVAEAGAAVADVVAVRVPPVR